jgi:membrane protease YdiL (CAAX protease family)
MLILPFNFLNVQNFDPSNYLQITTLRVIEIGLLFALYKRDLLSMAGITDYIKILTDIGLGFLIAVTGLFTLFILLYLKLTPFFDTLITDQKTSIGLIQVFLFVISGGLIAPLAEELFFRACLLNLIPKKTSIKVALPNLILIACIFVLPHINFNSTAADITFIEHIKSQQFNIFIWMNCSIVTIFLTLWRRSIITGWIVHCMANITLYLIQNGLLQA